MKKLTTNEIKQFAEALSFSQSEAKDITNLFYNLKIQYPLGHLNIILPLNNVDEYIKEWENHWHRELSIEECFECEKDGYYYSYDPKLAQKIFKNIESFKEYAMKGDTQFVYQLPNNKMVAVVC